MHCIQPQFENKSVSISSVAGFYTLFSLLFLYPLLFHITFFSHSFPPKPWRATPRRCLSSLTSHLIPSRPISSLLICSSNHNHHTPNVHLHQTTPHPCQAQTPGPFEALSVNDSSPLYCCVKPKVQLYKGFGTSVCVCEWACPPMLWHLIVVFYEASNFELWTRLKLLNGAHCRFGFVAPTRPHVGKKNMAPIDI